jgi:ribosomal protein S18 acetylase RimI-like enzyme
MSNRLSTVARQRGFDLRSTQHDLRSTQHNGRVVTPFAVRCGIFVSDRMLFVSAMNIRPATPSDADAIWRIVEPVIRGGETYALPAEWSRDEALAYWRSPGHTVYVAEDDGDVVGTYYLRANQRGGGGHVANCAFMTAPSAAGRGVGAAMCAHALEAAASAGFRAMQFNFVVSTNKRAVALWRRFGFDIVGRLPGAFRHPRLGPVDALVMHRTL